MIAFCQSVFIKDYDDDVPVCQQWASKGKDAEQGPFHKLSSQ